MIDLHAKRLDGLDPRWTSRRSFVMANKFWSWHEENGVFSYHLNYDQQAAEFWLTVDRVDMGRSRILGPYKNHSTVTKKILSHIAGEEI